MNRLKERPALVGEHAIGKMVVDFTKREISCGATQVHLKPKECSVLELLTRYNDRIIPRTEIFEHLYPPDFKLASEIITVYICILRQKIAKATGGASYIATFQGTGGCAYTLVLPRESTQFPTDLLIAS